MNPVLSHQISTRGGGQDLRRAVFGVVGGGGKLWGQSEENGMHLEELSRGG